MAQRILEPGQIETLAQRSIPRVRLPDRTDLFVRRASRLRELAEAAPIGDYLRLLAVVADAQHAALAGVDVPLPTPAQRDVARGRHMPPVPAVGWPRSAHWRATLASIGDAVAARSGFPAEVERLAGRVGRAPAAWVEAQADALLGATDGAIDAAAAPFLMAALQVHWVAMSSRLAADDVAPLDVPGLCPVCGSTPVASVVRAQSAYRGYRYLHCPLCACEWHLVRVQCSRCGAAGKDIAYRSLVRDDGMAGDDAAHGQGTAVRAETCDRCHGYRKILYQEADPDVDPVADDLATLALDLLLAEQGYARASGNPLLWQPDA